MPAPKIIKQEGKFILVETDYKVMNMFDYRAYSVVYGDYPVVYKRYDTTDQANWVVAGGTQYPKLFIVSPGNWQSANGPMPWPRRRGCAVGRACLRLRVCGSGRQSIHSSRHGRFWLACQENGLLPAHSAFPA